MKKCIYVLVMMLVTAMTMSCSFSKVDADEEAVLTLKPWFFGHGGVCDTPIYSVK